MFTRAVEHVVHSTSDPNVSVCVPLGAVAGHVVTGKPGEVGLLKPGVIAVHGSHYSGPRFLECDVTFGLTFLNTYKLSFHYLL